MRVALVQMPYATTSLPSLGLSLLKGSLESRGHSADIFHFNLLFAGIVGRDIVESIATDGLPQQDLLGEWTFSEAVWGPDPGRDTLYHDNIVLGADRAHRKLGQISRVEEMWTKAQRCRSQVPAFLDQCLAAAAWDSYQVVGFTSMFEQTLASVAFARMLRTRHPSVKRVFGGANCEGPMGLALLDAFEDIDAVCIGEGEKAFPDYIDALQAGGDAETPPGMRARTDYAASAPGFLPAGETVELAARVDMDDLPIPNYDAFFDQYKVNLGPLSKNVRITFESSRGCWWGQKNHCTFCGLNGSGMAFRNKTATRALSELEELKTRYAVHAPKFSAADNIIPHTYFQDFLPKLVERNDDLDIFYETKANLRKDQVELYRKAGLKFIQPGVESLDSGILKLMRKGVSALQNIQLLKWCREFGVKPLWNLLYGFPGEEPAAYARQAQLIGSLTHLTPPNGTGLIRFDRFSPYFSHPQDHGVSNLLPFPAYRYIYPGLDECQIAGLAYFFDGDYANKPDITAYTAEMRACMEEWIADAPSAALFHIDNDNTTMVFDLRDRQSVEIIILKGDAQRLYAHCTAIVTRDELCRAMPDMPRDVVDGYLDDLKAHRLVLEENGRVLGLSLTLASTYRPPKNAADRLRCALGAADTALASVGVPASLIKATIGDARTREAERVLDPA